MKLYTIGHSNHEIKKFISLLEERGIDLVVDVRSSPYSKYNIQYNKEALEVWLRQHGIGYAYAGQYLGGRPKDALCYKHRVLPAEGTDYLHEVDYPEVMKRHWFIKGIERLLELADEQVVAILCSEEDPEKCHRHHLIARYLLAEYPEIDIRHIRGDGVVFSAKSIHTIVDDAPAAEQMPLF
jgi:uncharacterized protein (DUF488 family)